MIGDEIVITGILGKFPNCENVRIFQENILNMVDCIADDDPRWMLGSSKIPERTGKMKDVDKFDAILFDVNQELANAMDPMMRILMECAYKAVADSTNDLRQLKGRKCVVFLGCSSSETEKYRWVKTGGEMNSFNLLGSASDMLSNRISFFLGVNGPSITLINLCIGTSAASEGAYKLMESDEVDSAMVCGGSAALHSEVSLQLFNLGLLSPDGITRSYNNAANGQTRSRAAVVLYLQEARDVKRIYAEIKGVRSMNGSSNNQNSVLHPTCDSQMKVMKMILEDSGISEKDVSFAEADGMAIREVDAKKIRAIDKVYNEGRSLPLHTESVRSNVGTCFAANTLISILKVLTMINSVYISPNLHFENPSEKIPALKDGRIKVVIKPTNWTGHYAVVNTTSIGGGSSSVILKSYTEQKKNPHRFDYDLPRMITVSDSNEEAVTAILAEVESKPVDIGVLQLVNDVFNEGNLSHIYRDYSLLPSHGSVQSKIRKIQYSQSNKREIWFLFSGMGSQWAGMGEAFMKIPVFADVLQNCNAVLKPHGMDITRILTEKNPKMFDYRINSFVGIATCQIGLVDLLTYIGIKPNFVTGHSVGELGCAYAHGCFTAEQMVLSALSHGLASVGSNLPKGSMAAIGLRYEQINQLCSPDVDVACHNSSTSSTISGPAETVKNLVADLKAKGIFEEEVACSNIAFHGRYIAPAGVKLKDYLQKVIPNTQLRSHRWVSSSVPRSEWNSADARLSSAENHTNNLLIPDLFDETARAIPANAVVIEIANYGLLQAIVKKSLPEGTGNFKITLESTLLSSGVLRRSYSKDQEQIKICDKIEKRGEELNNSDIYSEPRLRGLQDSGSFRSIHTANANGSKGVLVAQEEWVTLVEGMLQMYIFGKNLRRTQVPLKVVKIIFDMKQYKEKSQITKLTPVLVDQQLHVVRLVGIRLEGISLMNIQRDPSKGLVDIEKMRIKSASVESVKTQSIPIVPKDREVANWIACQIRPNDLNSIEWVERQLTHNPDSNKVVRVEYATIDESDLLLATGRMTSDIKNSRKDTKQLKSRCENFGLEYSGVDEKGTPVMGISGNGTFSSFTIPDQELIWRVPKTWNLQDAATVPLAYASSYMALNLKGGMKKKESVLIYDGFSVFGQASINLALSEECEVFTTYETSGQQLFLKKQYHASNENFHLCSINAFVIAILTATKGAGVDLVIYNSSSFDKIESCLACVRSQARVIVLGNLLEPVSVSVGMEIFVKEVSLHSIIPKNLVEADLETRRKLAKMVKDGIITGAVKPLPLILYSREVLRKAFADSSDNGFTKIVVKVQPGNPTGRASIIESF